MRKSQKPMVNELMVREAKKRPLEVELGEVSGENIGGNKKVRHTFKQPTNANIIQELSHKNFAPHSKRKMRWAVNMFSKWRANRLRNGIVPSEIVNANLDGVFSFAQQDLAYALSCFISEVKKIGGDDYPPNTLREIIIVIQMYLHENGIMWKLLDGDNFVKLHNVLDNLMKGRMAIGMGTKVSSSIISLEQESVLFQKGILGEHSPGVLLDTVIYMMGLHLALRGGVEHCRLRRPGFDSQITVNIDDKGRERLVYHEDPLAKNNQGGIGSKSTSKIVYVYSASDQTRCLVRLFKKYVRLLPDPKSCRKLYLRPRVNPTPSLWYCDQALGNNKISSTVKRLCNLAGFEGKFTNRSLHAFSASRMFECEVPEQIIKEVTGHRSDCVRIYKRTSDDIRQKASVTISGNGSEGMVEKEAVKVASKTESIENSMSEKEKMRNKESLSACQMIKNVVKTRIEMRKKRKDDLMSKIAKIIVKKNRLNSVKRTAKKVGSQRVVVDLNVNVKIKK